MQNIKTQKYKTLIIVKLRLNIITNKGVDWEIAYNTNGLIRLGAATVHLIYTC